MSKKISKKKQKALSEQIFTISVKMDHVLYEQIDGKCYDDAYTIGLNSILCSLSQFMHVFIDDNYHLNFIQEITEHMRNNIILKKADKKFNSTNILH